MPFDITPIQNNSDRQRKDDIEFSPRADFGIHSLTSSIQSSPKSQNSSPYENRALFPPPQVQSHTFPMTPMPRQLPEQPNPIRDSQPSNSNTPPNFTSASDESKIAQFATKFKEKYKRKDLNNSLG